MEKRRQGLRSRGFACALWVALCFGLASAVYLSWLDRLVALTGGAAADWLSMGAGYLMQAAGMGWVCRLLRRNPGQNYRRAFTIAAVFLATVSVPALLTDSAAGVVCFGMIANLLCGVIAGFYLYAIGRHIDAAHRSRAFGGGYAIATVAVGLLTLIGRGSLLHSGRADSRDAVRRAGLRGGLSAQRGQERGLQLSLRRHRGGFDPGAVAAALCRRACRRGLYQ